MSRSREVIRVANPTTNEHVTEADTSAAPTPASESAPSESEAPSVRTFVIVTSVLR